MAGFLTRDVLRVRCFVHVVMLFSVVILYFYYFCQRIWLHNFIYHSHRRLKAVRRRRIGDLFFYIYRLEFWNSLINLVLFVVSQVYKIISRSFSGYIPAPPRLGWLSLLLRAFPLPFQFSSSFVFSSRLNLIFSSRYLFSGSLLQPLTLCQKWLF